MARIYANGTPLPSFDQGPARKASDADATCAPDNKNNDNISIASFNLLAPLYIRPIDQRTGKIQPFASFNWVSKEDSEAVLGNDVRLPKLVQRMQNCQSDFICVQELQLERGGELEMETVNCNLPQITGGRRSRKEGVQVDNVIHNQQGNTTKKPPFVIPKWITPLTDANYGDYNVILPPQSELEKIAERNQRVLLADTAITNAIFYKRDSWTPISESNNAKHSKQSKQTKESRIPFHNSTTCVLQAFLPLECAKKQNPNPDPIVVASIHLDAKSEEKRVQQLQRCLERSYELSDTPYAPPFIIAGDFNCELFPGSCVHAFLANDKNDKARDDAAEKATNAKDSKHVNEISDKEMQTRMHECSKALRLPSNSLPSKEQMQNWNDLHVSVTSFVQDYCWMLKRVDTGCTRVAYDHDEEMTEENENDPDATNDKNQRQTSSCDADNSANEATQEQDQRTMDQWHLDHILYTSCTLVPLGKWSTLEEDDYSSTKGLPNDRVPTDHLPIATLFQRRSHPRIDVKVRDSLIGAIKELECRQKEEMKNLLMLIDKERSELENRLKPKEDDTPDRTPTQQKKKQKKKKSGPPPPEIIEHVRSSRARIKALRSEQRTKRDQFMNARSRLEKLELQYFLGGKTSTQWIDTDA